jgi:thiamine pyrophosphate-dependent acetolactate synthase large subunit-like protein
MTDDDEQNSARRDFLKGVAAAGAVAGIGAAARAQPESPPPASAGTPSSAVQAMERSPPAGYGEAEAARLFVRHAGSDVMVDVLRSLGIDYVATNPAASFRGLHESIVNYAGNARPELLTCLHEESAVAMAQGYAKAAGKPLAVMCDGVVGLQHAAMAVYNAWCDRTPIYIIAGNYAEATVRRTPVEWAHSASAPALLLRDFIKWDDTPASLAHFAESAVRAFKIATTPPMGPVVIVADAELQEKETGASPPAIPKLAATVPPQGDAGAVAEAARWLALAERPVIVADRAARTAAGMQLLIELAEALQAPVIDRLGRLNFPNDHPLNHTWRGRSLIGEADVILGLEVQDFWGTVAGVRDRVHREEARQVRPDVKLVSLGMSDLYLKSNYQDFQRYLGVDLAIAGDAEATLPALTEAVRRAAPERRRSGVAKRGAGLREGFAAMRAEARKAAVLAWDARPVTTARLCMEIWRRIEGREWTLASEPYFQGFWPHRLWVMNEYQQYHGGSGGYGVGYGAPGAVGVALGHRASGRLCVNIQSDGDLLYAPGVLWTAAHHRIPLLSVMHNNGAYHQEVMHVQRMAARRNRGVDDRAWIGTTFNQPPIDFAALAKSLGVWSAGPIRDAGDLGPALERAIEVVERGEPALIDVECQPR